MSFDVSRFGYLGEDKFKEDDILGQMVDGTLLLRLLDIGVVSVPVRVEQLWHR
jgi:hypothetical protein